MSKICIIKPYKQIWCLVLYVGTEWKNDITKEIDSRYWIDIESISLIQTISLNTVQLQFDKKANANKVLAVMRRFSQSRWYLLNVKLFWNA